MNLLPVNLDELLLAETEPRCGPLPPVFDHESLLRKSSTRFTVEQLPLVAPVDEVVSNAAKGSNGSVVFVGGPKAQNYRITLAR